MKRNFVIVVGTIMLVLLGGVTAQVIGPTVINPDSVAYGRTYSQWSAAWWQWAFSIPVAHHPLFDRGNCSIGQSGRSGF